MRLRRSASGMMWRGDGVGVEGGTLFAVVGDLVGLGRGTSVSFGVFWTDFGVGM